jgi:hypothetical protein
MRSQTSAAFPSPVACGTLDVQGVTWTVHLLAAERHPGVWHLRLLVVPAELAAGGRHVEVRVAADPGHWSTAARVMHAVRSWLADIPGKDAVSIDLVAAEPPAPLWESRLPVTWH